MKSHTLHAILLFSVTSVLHAQEPPRKGEMPGSALMSPVDANGVKESEVLEEPLYTRSYSLGFLLQGYGANGGRGLQKTALGLISLALNSDPAPEAKAVMQGDTGVLIARGTSAQLARIDDILRILRENMPDGPAAAARATDNSVARIYALGRIFGQSDSGNEQHKEERAAKTQALISQIRTSMAMARVDATMPELSFHGSSNSLIAKGTVAQMELITQAITCWRENTPDHRPVRGQ